MFVYYLAVTTASELLFVIACVCLFVCA